MSLLSLFRRTPRTRYRDEEFLPAALEILEAPPSPIRLIFMRSICVMASLILLWAWVGHFDIVAVGQGKIQPVGRVKVIESVESGRVKSLPPANGTAVAKGDRILTLDDAEAIADVAARTADFRTLSAEVARRVLYAESLAALQSVQPLPDDHAERVEHLASNQSGLWEKAVYDADMQNLAVMMASLEAERRRQVAEMEGLEHTLRARRSLVQTSQRRLDMREKLARVEAASQGQLIDAVKEHDEALAAMTQTEAEFNVAKASVRVAADQRAKLLNATMAENEDKLLAVRKSAEAAEKELTKSQARLQKLRILAPVDGTIQLSSVVAEGQVVTAGQEIMRIVPTNERLEVEAFIANRDIGFIRQGQNVVIKVDAYPFTRYGMLSGQVVRVSADAVPEPEAVSVEAGDHRGAHGPIPVGNVQRVQNLVYPVTISLNDPATSGKEWPFPVATGMTVTVEVNTGDRRILEYLLSPLAEIQDQAMNER